MDLEPDTNATGTSATDDRLAAARTWIATHVAAVRDTQGRLQSLLDEKQTALGTADTSRIAALVSAETAAAGELEHLRQQRDRWLATQPLREPVHSLGEAAVAAAADESLIEQIEAARRQAAAIQQQNWTHWVLAQRSAAHFEELLGLIARKGQTAATYHEGPETPLEGGGGILDAAA